MEDRHREDECYEQETANSLTRNVQDPLPASIAGLYQNVQPYVEHREKRASLGCAVGDFIGSFGIGRKVIVRIADHPLGTAVAAASTKQLPDMAIGLLI